MTTTNARTAVPWGALAHGGKQRTRLHQKLARIMLRTVDRWRLIEPGDRLLVAISGGKDSYALLDLLWQAKQRAPFPFELTALHVDQAQPGYDGRPLVRWLEQHAVPFEVVREDTYSIVVDKTREGQAYCFLCARLRRGILYSAAERLGCNKLALGHHRDDGLETLLLNLCYAGKLQAMPARYTSDDGKLEVIRPLIDVAEAELRAFAAERAYPILPCNLCGAQDGLKREQMAALLASLEHTIPNVRSVMHHAVGNVRPTHLLDADVREAWRARPQAAPVDDAASDAAPRRMTGTVTARGGLAILDD
ncbi:MAG: tRNA 2-thiocytidine(32) synthetase TtcA [Deltaproteobacteria bacterium RBG_16_71_12]|nr:MAG: tRNA 2-thiocytidine(32) synthetase TtcA [Deltaproteobacteria bacterium RBG_16_71_12]